MKKYVYLISILIILAVILTFIFQPKKPTREVLFLNETHYILNDGTTPLNFTYFTNDKDFLLIEEDSYGFIENEDKTFKFIAEDLKISEIHTEIYRKQTFYGYQISIKLPDINGTYHFEKLYFKLYSFGNDYHFFVGELYVEYPMEDFKDLKWIGLEGIKASTPKLKQILIDVQSEVLINEIHIGPHLVDYYYMDKLLVINVPEELYIFHSTYIKIIIGNQVSYLPNFKYFINYELLSSGYHQKYLI